MVYRCHLRVWGTLALIMGAIACHPNPVRQADPTATATVGGDGADTASTPALQSVPGDAAIQPSPPSTHPSDRPRPQGSAMGPGSPNATPESGDRHRNAGTKAQPKHGQAGIGDISPVKGSRPAPTAPAAAAIRPCQGTAYVRTQNGEQVPVREGPNGDFAAIATLTPAQGVQLTGNFDNWMQVRPATTGDRPSSDVWQVGWIYGPRLGVRLQGNGTSVSLYSRPAVEEVPQARLPADTEASLLGCTADWVKVQTPDGTGWVSVGQTCPQSTGACPP